MKIYSLMENTPYSPDFSAEHGLSLYIETRRHNILFDFGQTFAFADNADRLGIDLRKVDVAFLSHGHDDHGGGIAKFFELNKHAPVYLSRYAFEEHYNGTDEYIGLAPELKGNPRLVFVDDQLTIDDELELCSCNSLPLKYTLDSAGLTERQNGRFIPESFRHEQYLIIHSAGQKVLVSGCSHKGILNIMEWLQPDVLVGGFHFMKNELSGGGNPVIDKAVSVLSEYDTVYYTCHCTGVAQYKYMKEKMGTRLHYLASGQIVTI